MKGIAERRLNKEDVLREAIQAYKAVFQKARSHFPTLLRVRFPFLLPLSYPSPLPFADSFPRLWLGSSPQSILLWLKEVLEEGTEEVAVEEVVEEEGEGEELPGPSTTPSLPCPSLLVLEWGRSASALTVACP